MQSTLKYEILCSNSIAFINVSSELLISVLLLPKPLIKTDLFYLIAIILLLKDKHQLRYVKTMV